MTEKLCSCGGWNENCYRCAGRGYYIPRRRRSHVPAQAITGQSVPVKKTLPGPPAWAIPRQSPRWKLVATGRFKKCTVCGCLVRADRLLRHMRRGHQNIQRIKTQRPTLEKCTACGCPVRADRLLRHILRVHRNTKRTKTGRSYRDIARVNEPKSKCHAAFDSQERKLDGSADYWRFREGGKFGSYPSFDAMGDQSRP